MIGRRSFFLGAASLLAAPSIVRVASIMPVKAAADRGLWWRETALFASYDAPFLQTAEVALLPPQRSRVVSVTQIGDDIPAMLDQIGRNLTSALTEAGVSRAEMSRGLLT